MKEVIFHIRHQPSGSSVAVGFSLENGKVQQSFLLPINGNVVSLAAYSAAKKAAKMLLIAPGSEPT